MQRVADVVEVLLVHAGKGKLGEPLRRVDVELAGILPGNTHRDDEEQSTALRARRLLFRHLGNPAHHLSVVPNRIRIS
jgi:hypothetical protein